MMLLAFDAGINAKSPGVKWATKALWGSIVWCWDAGRVHAHAKAEGGEEGWDSEGMFGGRSSAASIVGQENILQMPIGVCVLGAFMRLREDKESVRMGIRRVGEMVGGKKRDRAAMEAGARVLMRITGRCRPAGTKTEGELESVQDVDAAPMKLRRSVYMPLLDGTLFAGEDGKWTSVAVKAKIDAGAVQVDEVRVLEAKEVRIFWGELRRAWEAVVRKAAVMSEVQDGEETAEPREEEGEGDRLLYAIWTNLLGAWVGCGEDVLSGSVTVMTPSTAQKASAKDGSEQDQLISSSPPRPRPATTTTSTSSIVYTPSVTTLGALFEKTITRVFTNYLSPPESELAGQLPFVRSLWVVVRETFAPSSDPDGRAGLLLTTTRRAIVNSLLSPAYFAVEDSTNDWASLMTEALLSRFVSATLVDEKGEEETETEELVSKVCSSVQWGDPCWRNVWGLLASRWVVEDGGWRGAGRLLSVPFWYVFFGGGEWDMLLMVCGVIARQG